MLNFCNRFNSPTFDSSKRSKLKSEDDVRYLFSQAKTRSTLLYVVSCGPKHHLLIVGQSSRHHFFTPRYGRGPYVNICTSFHEN